jgi:RNA polymerase sigma-70 factor (ECF subfamily)
MDLQADIVMASRSDIRWENKEDLNQLLPAVYDELRRLARAQFRRERGAHTLQPTALVHEVYFRLADQRMPLESRNHLLALAATQMRRILLDYARKHRRRGGSGERESIDDQLAIEQQRPVDVITLDAALTKLAALDPAQARLVELRFFGGLSLAETAEAMSVSTATVKRSWNSARAFLRREMERGAHDTRAMGSDPANL